MSATYGQHELEAVQPIVDALIESQSFREWFLSQTEFVDRIVGAKLLHEEMKARRSGVAATWWRSHFTESCRCEGCRCQETDPLAIFEDSAGARFANHVEVKNPRDSFKKGGTQAQAYEKRAS